MIVMPKYLGHFEKRKRFLRRELDRLGKIPIENILPEVLPFLQTYLTELNDELRSYEDDTA
jgi:hypothetical protein